MACLACMPFATPTASSTVQCLSVDDHDHPKVGGEGEKARQQEDEQREKEMEERRRKVGGRGWQDWGGERRRGKGDLSDLALSCMSSAWVASWMRRSAPFPSWQERRNAEKRK
eukprot:753007-Hanusia_phi.AAC.5